MIKYGLISQTDARTLEATIDLIHNHEKVGINITEIGLFNCGTAMGLVEYATSKGLVVKYTGIDNEKDKPVENIPQWMNFIKGNSNEVYNQIEDNSQHLIIVDGLHTFAGVISDFFCYAPKVKVGGFIAFHDTGKHIDPLHGWQGVGFENDPDFCLGGVRKALNVLDLLNENDYSIFGQYSDTSGGWKLIFDQADPNDEAGGFTVFQKLY